MQSSRMTDMVLFAYVAVIASAVLFQCGLFQSDLYKHFDKCCFVVIDDPKSVQDITTDIRSNEQTSDNDQTISSRFSCLHKETRKRSGYESVD